MLEKKKTALKLMEKLIEEGKNYQPPQTQDTTASTSHSQPQGTKRKPEERTDEFEVRQAVDKKRKTINDDLLRLVNEARNLNDYEALEAKIKEIDKYQGEAEYDSRQ